MMEPERIPFFREVKDSDYKSTLRKRRLTEVEEIYEYVNMNGIYFYVDSKGKISSCTLRGRNAMSPKTADANTNNVFVPYMRPEKLPRLESIKRGFYDPTNKTILGRTPKGWGGILTFYFIFFSVLAAIFAICMYAMMSTLSPDYPRWQLSESIIGTNPGLGFRPYSGDVEKHGSLIWYVAANESNVMHWTGVLDQFLEGYLDNQQRENKVICDFDRPPMPGKVCDVRIDDFGPCSKEKGYSYNQSSPCIFIKLNRIFNWVPEFYNETDSLPDEMDEDLKQHISETTPAERNVVWITCYGENPADRENLGGVQYYPKRGFPGFYYPFTNTPGYLSPLVAVHFQRPALHTLINVECRAWAKNIEYKRALQHREGSVHFELLID
ncbi:hypothetical protein RUM43_008806 [Polyplax serrata]|uniref:Sodium/potassium-transporting ATPase subunit beta-2 n=1 Tax=Polyplax serrata TaxID=468196 RepID=A0AAN8RU08_POLSC